MARRAAATKGNANLLQLQQLQLQFNPSGELKAGHSPKTFRISDCADNWDDYGYGSIVRIRLINFQKYTDCLIRPGAYMNMLIGPNGTGKSTIVAAIALGLGATPGVLGRSKNVTEFIKYNAASATIELILKCQRPEEPTPPFVAIKRVIRRTKLNDSENDWYINGNISTHKEVVALGNKLGAQITNLCQFLPQDKVSEFAQMTPEQMLVATMEAAASEETLVQYTQLVKLKKEERKLSEALKVETTELGDNQRALTNLQALKQRYKEREERKKKLELLKLKRPWLRYKKARDDFNDLKAERDRLRAELEAATAEVDQELNEQIKQVERKIRDGERRLKRLHSSVFDTKRDVETIHGQACVLAAKIKSKKADIMRKRELVQKTRDKHEKERQELRVIEDSIAQMQQEINSNNFSTNVEAADREAKRLNREYGGLERRIDELTSEKERISEKSKRLRDSEVKMRQKMEQFKNIRTRRLEMLHRLNPHISYALQWIEENKNKFRGSIVGPIALDLQVKDEKMTQAVESVISRSLLVSFVCDNVRDHDDFTRVCEQNGWRVNSVLLENYRQGAPAPECPWSRKDLKALGFDGLVSELLEGPETILSALYEMAKIHLIPVCRDVSTNIDTQGCERVRGLMKFLSQDTFFEIKRSRYNDRDVAMRSSPLKPGFILSAGAGDGVDIPALQARIDAVRVELDREQEMMRGVLERLDAAARAKEALKEERERVAEMKAAAMVKKANLKKQELQREKLRKSVRDSLNFLQNETDESESLEDLTQLFRERAELLGTMQRALSAFHVQVHEAGVEGMSHQLEVLKLKDLKRQREQRQGVYGSLQRQVRQAEEDTERAKASAQDALKIAEMQEMDSETREALKLITTDTIEALEAQIAAEVSWISAGGSGDHFGQGDLAELEQRAQSAQELADRIERRKREIEDLHGQMREIGATWRQAVDEMIRAISDKFEHFFAKISCEGKVTLGVPPNDATNFDAYYLAIWVKFRASESLQRLTGQRQSGGEKSVSTILYLLSLQELSRAPFRVVDEINQGMDVENERRVHALMVETATNAAGRKAQYFLITPKLLMGLEYHEKMHILCIYNGPGMLIIYE